MSPRAVLSVTLGLLVAGCASGRGGGGGGGTYTNQVRGYLARQATNARGQGYTRGIAGPVYGRLNDNGRSTHRLTVRGGTSYVLFGACDNDCTDVDLRIFDTSGNLVMQDLGLDDTPALAFTASGTGSYRIEVIMATCRRNPCYYGIQLMAR